MNIVYTFDRHFLPQVMAGITSVCVNNQSADRIEFYLLHTDLRPEDQESVRNFIEQSGRRVHFIQLENIGRYFPFEVDTSGWNPIVLARLLLERLLPEEVGRVLYLDGDTMVRGSLGELWNLDLESESCVVGASLEPTYNRDRKADIGLAGRPYYNAGVLLIDLRACRKEGTGEQVIRFYEQRHGRLFSNDQDAINGCLAGKIRTLSPRYNYFNIYDQYPYGFFSRLCDYPYGSMIPKAEFAAARQDPVIVHFLGEERPWRRGNHHRFRREYLRYLDMTPWRGEGFEDHWRTYYAAWYLFNCLTRPFPGLRYRIIDGLIPAMVRRKSRRR